MREMCMRSRSALAVLLAAMLLAGLALVTGISPVAAAGTSISITPSSQTVNAGDTFTVKVDIESDQAIGGAQCQVAWSPAANIQCTSVAKGADFVAAGASWIPNTISIDNTAGLVPNATEGAASATIIGGSLAAGTHTFLTLTFQAASDGLVNVTLQNAIVMDTTYGEIPGLTVNNGTVQVGAVPAVDYVVLSKNETAIPGTDNYTITYTIENQGSLPSNQGTTTYVYIDDMVSPRAMIFCPALAAGASDTQTIGPFTLTAGSDTIRVCADGPNVIVEGNEANNCTTNQFPALSTATVTVVPSAGTVAVGQSFEVAIEVSVTGSSRGAQAVLGWELPERASCSSVQADTFYTDPYLIPGAIDNTNGVVALTAVLATPPAPCATGTGDFLVYQFQALEAGVAQFSLSDVIVMDCNGNEIAGITVTGGQVVITATCSTELAGNPIATIIIDCPEPYTDWAFRVGRNIYSGVLNIRCNDVWRCDVADQDATTAGRMTEWDGTAYVAGGAKLDSKLQVRCTSESTLVTLPAFPNPPNPVGKIADGDTSGQSGNSGQDFAVEFIQDTEFDDAVLHGGHVYHIVVTFTAYITA